MKESFDKLSYDYNKDKNFYEEALEARMNQLEELENENEHLKRKLDEKHKMTLDLQAQLEQLNFDNEMIQRNLSSNSQEKQTLSKKED